MSDSNYANIGETKSFNADDYPTMVAEMLQVAKDLQQLPIYFRKEIFISFVKDHCIKTEWSDANPTLATKMTSGSLSTAHIEKLFEGARWNKPFRLDLERFIKARLN